MKNIVVVGVSGAGINFLKNIFLLCNKLRLDLPYVPESPIQDRYLFMVEYYSLLVDKMKRLENWLEHEWALRVSFHWTDELDLQDRLIKVNPESPTVFVMHHENEIFVNSPLDIVTVLVDNTSLCDTMYRLKSKNPTRVNRLNNPMMQTQHPQRTYHTILFSELLKNPVKIFELTQTLKLDIELDKIKHIHGLWTESNRILFSTNDILDYDL